MTSNQSKTIRYTFFQQKTNQSQVPTSASSKIPPPSPPHFPYKKEPYYLSLHFVNVLLEKTF